MLLKIKNRPLVKALVIGILVTATVMACYFWSTFYPQSNHHAAVEGPSGSVRWGLLSKAKEFGFSKDLKYIPRTYPKDIKALANTEISIKGYMITLKAREKFTKFLLVPFPPSCPYCSPAGPNQTIQVETSEPVTFSPDPVLIKGIFHLNDGPFPSEIFYAMDDAKLINE